MPTPPHDGQGAVDDRIREVLAEMTEIRDVMSLDRDADLYAAGLSSLETVAVTLAIEDAWDIRIDDAFLSKQMFRSIASLNSVVSDLLEEKS